MMHCRDAEAVFEENQMERSREDLAKEVVQLREALRKDAACFGRYVTLVKHLCKQLNVDPDVVKGLLKMADGELNS
jgi:hypothetical protein